MLTELSLNTLKDIVIWKFNKGLFTTKSCYNALLNLDNRSEGNWTKIWKIKVPPKIHIFIWKVEHGILPTAAFLHNRLWNSIDPRCKICGICVENQQNLFWDCCLAKQVWDSMINWWSLDRRQANTLNTSFWQILNIFKGCKISAVWAQVICSVLWSLWLSRNNLIFNNKYYNSKEITDLLIFRTFKWCLAVDWIK